MEGKTYTQAQLDAAKDKVKNYWKGRAEILEKKAFEAGAKNESIYKGSGIIESKPIYPTFEDYKRVEQKPEE